MVQAPRESCKASGVPTSKLQGRPSFLYAAGQAVGQIKPTLSVPCTQPSMLAAHKLPTNASQKAPPASWIPAPPSALAPYPHTWSLSRAIAPGQATR